MHFRLLTIAFITLLSVLTQTACMTKSLHSPKYTTETVRGFYISADERSLVAIGDKQHYVFPLESNLKKVLAWDGRPKVQAAFGQFTLLGDGKVAGTYTLKVRVSDIGSAEQQYLKDAGFSQERQMFFSDGTLQGQSYPAKKLGEATSFNRPYTVLLVGEPSIPAAARLALTPVAVAADGALLIGGVPLLALYCTARDAAGKRCFPAGL